MAYIGNRPADPTEADNFVVDNFTAGVGFTAGSSTQLTLSNAPATENAIIVTMDGVTQHHNTYSVSGTTLTFDEAIPSGVSNIEVQFYIKAILTTVADASVTAAKLDSGAVTAGKIATGGVSANTQLAAGIVTSHGIAANAVTTGKVVDNAVTLAKLADGTQGDILYYGASGAPALLGAGTSGQFLKTQGAGANPTWGAVATGPYTQIMAAEPTTAAAYLNIEWGTGLGSTYSKLIIHIYEFSVTTAGQDVFMEVKRSGGYATTTYRRTLVSTHSNGSGPTLSSDNAANSGRITASVFNHFGNSNDACQFTINLDQLDGGNRCTATFFGGMLMPNSYHGTFYGTFTEFGGSGDYEGIRFYASAGVVAGGYVVIGVPRS